MPAEITIEIRASTGAVTYSVLPSTDALHAVSALCAAVELGCALLGVAFSRKEISDDVEPGSVLS